MAGCSRTYRRLEDLDNREPFPMDWLEEQIVDGRTYLSDEEYTNPSEVKEALIELVRKTRNGGEY